jgi:hypothetical protein
MARLYSNFYLSCCLVTKWCHGQMSPVQQIIAKYPPCIGDQVCILTLNLQFQFSIGFELTQRNLMTQFCRNNNNFKT